MNISKINKTIIVSFRDGSLMMNDNCSDELFEEIVNNRHNEEYIMELLDPLKVKKQKEIAKIENFLEEIRTSSNIMKVKGTRVIIPSISELTLPEEFVKAILEAEIENKEELLDSYLNFWTHCCLNPDSRARHNLFWFLKKYGMKISKSGFFIAYRLVNIKEGGNYDKNLINFITDKFIKVKSVWKKSTDNYYIGYKDDSLHMTNNETNLDECIGNLTELYYNVAKSDGAVIYTDSYTNTFRIKVGEIVSMPRKDCDPIQENTCSQGLHAASKDWLERNRHFGSTTLTVLINPADVVACPPDDNYGKLRTCAYYPIAVTKFNEDNKIIEQIVESGFEDDFVNKVYFSTEGDKEDTVKASVEIPNIVEINKMNIYDRLEHIKNSLSNKILWKEK